MEKQSLKSKRRIHRVEVTEDTLTGRGGLALFARYLEQIGIYGLLLERFSHLRKSKKGSRLEQLFKQVFCFLCDGTSRHLSYFDSLKQDAGYAAVLENRERDMVSSHQVKRFFRSFSWLCAGWFRRVLQRLFIWRLNLEQPEIIELMLDTMVMDNDEAPKRHGVQPTYKKVKGFQPLQMIWDGRIVDAVFRGGKKHSNHGHTASAMVRALVSLIRKEYSGRVPVIVRMDAGFFDEALFKALDKLEVGFICGGKMYAGVKEYAESQPERAWGRYDNSRRVWSFLEWGYRCDAWKRFYRAIYTRPLHEDDGQGILEFARPDNILVTNIGVNPGVLAHCPPELRRDRSRTESIIRSHHQRGADELPHRGLKDFGFEALPFKRFPANSAFYYCMAIAFFLFETFKQDVLSEVLPITCYATTVRRKALDFAAKIVRTGRETILKVTRSVMKELRFDRLWERCQHPPSIPVS